MKNTYKIRRQYDQNYGRVKGWLESVIYESTPGRWELLCSYFHSTNPRKEKNVT